MTLYWLLVSGCALSAWLIGYGVAQNFFQVLGIQPALGRTFDDEECKWNGRKAVMLSHGLWQRRFGSDPLVVSRTVRLNRENYVIVGVMPPDFALMGYTPQAWTPLVLSAADQAAAARKDRSLRLFGRLKPEVTLAQAQAEFTALARRAETEFPDLDRGWKVSLRTMPDFLIYSFGIRTGLAIVMTTVAALLGALPLALGTGPGHELRLPLGIAIVGRVFLSQFLTLYTTPVVYLALDWLRRRRAVSARLSETQLPAPEAPLLAAE